MISKLYKGRRSLQVLHWNPRVKKQPQILYNETDNQWAVSSDGIVGTVFDTRIEAIKEYRRRGGTDVVMRQRKKK